MKKFFYSLVTAIAVCMGIGSCSQKVDLENYVSHKSVLNNKVSVEEAKANVIDFVNNLNKTGTRSTHHSVNIANVEAISIGKVTRAGNSENTDTLFYIVNFSDSCGFAVASAKKEETPVLAFVEEGNYDANDTTNNGFNAFMSALTEHEIAGYTFTPSRPIEDIGGSGGNNTPDIFTLKKPLLQTKWGQGAVYNKYCPGPYTGCVITAVSQICSFLEQPQRISYMKDDEHGSAYMDWKKIKEESQRDTSSWSPNTKEQVARMMRFWGISFDADYKQDGTFADAGDAVKKMRSKFDFNVTNMSDYNAQNIISDLTSGNKIVMMIGFGRYYHVGLVFRNYVDGHAWVVDGYIFQRRSDRESRYLHCNWGWNGKSNGYFLDNVFNAEEKPVYDDNGELTRSSHNYRYKLQSSTFTK